MTEQNRSSARSRIFGVARIAIGLGLLYYLVVSGALDWRSLGGLVDEWPLTFAAGGLLVGALFLIAWRLCLLLHAPGFDISLSSSLRLTLIGLFFNVSLPGAAGGDVVKIYYAAAGNEGRRTEVATILLLDRLAGLIALAVWPLLIAPFFFQIIMENRVIAALLGVGLAVAIGLGGAVAVSFSSHFGPGSIAAKTLRRLPGGSLLERILLTVHSYRAHRSALAKAIGVSLLAHTLTMGGMLVLAESMAGGMAWEMALLMPLGFVANAIPLTPGGLGVGEAAFDTLFGMAGLQGGAEVLLGWRIFTLLFGLFGLGFYLRGRQRFVAFAREHAGVRE
jgi:uncharacterized membrane protein YbhN (UPF0104 family)